MGAIDILIPSCKDPDQLVTMIEDVQSTAEAPHQVVLSCRKLSASKNRNLCLDACDSSLAIMLDDDITGFCPGWDVQLIKPLLECPQLCAVSARLIRRDGRPAQTCARHYDLTKSWDYVQPNRHCVMPTAAIAFRPNPAIRFDERYLGSGWEDNDWFFQYKERGWKFGQSNECRLVHLNEQKAQNEHWEHNKKLFFQKWIIGA